MKTLPEYLNEVRQRAGEARCGLFPITDAKPVIWPNTRNAASVFFTKEETELFLHARQDVETLLEIVRLQAIALSTADYTTAVDDCHNAIAALLDEADQITVADKSVLLTDVLIAALNKLRKPEGRNELGKSI